MIREIIRPKYNNFTINIPNSYINREVEFIMFPLDEQEKIQEEKKENISILGGSLNKYSDLSKINLEDCAWELHTINKYK